MVQLFLLLLLKIELKQELIHQFYLDYKERLIKFAFALMRSQENAEEAVHNVFRKLGATKDLSKINNPYAYLIQCTKFEAYAIIAKEKKQGEVSFQFHQITTTEEDDTALTKDRIAQVRKAIESLPPKCKEIMLLKIDDGLSHQEISEFLKISVKTVENQVSIAIKKIRVFFKKI